MTCVFLLVAVLLCRFVAGGNPADAAFQLKSLIKALHAAGIEVLLEVRPS
jgi:pullulanase/glycogen debranching enzyme